MKNNDTLDGPWKVVNCGQSTLEEVLNELVAGGYLVHSIYQKDQGSWDSGSFTVCGIDQAFVQGVNILTEDQAKELKGKLDESNNSDTCKV
tara:strand:+ start:1892 stop:2164 length:273 start_codon:yes stop_codon:yes gene_type:complete